MHHRPLVLVSRRAGPLLPWEVGRSLELIDHLVRTAIFLLRARVPAQNGEHAAELDEGH